MSTPLNTKYEIVQKVLSVQTGHAAHIFTLDRQLDSYDIDSLDRVEIAMALEEEFGIAISDSAMEEWYTVNDILHTIGNA